MEGKTSWIVLAVICLAYQAQAAVNCTAEGAGRHADTSDATCKKYTLCVYDSSTGTYLSYDYTCPTTSLFNPNTSKCTTDYTCSSSSNTSTTNSSVCTSEGYIADPDSTNCTSYLECVLVDLVYTVTSLLCPNGTYFNPLSTLCDSTYNCTSSSNTTSTSSSFNCTTAGRFANTDDTSCKTYYYCIMSSDGSYTEYEYTCPTTSVFSPTTSMCTTSYNCTTAS